MAAAPVALQPATGQVVRVAVVNTVLVREAAQTVTVTTFTDSVPLPEPPEPELVPVAPIPEPLVPDGADVVALPPVPTLLLPLAPVLTRVLVPVLVPVPGGPTTFNALEAPGL